MNVSDFEARTHALDPYEKERVKFLINDAKTIIDAEFEAAKAKPKSQELIDTVIFSMVKRAFSCADFDGMAVSQYSQSASPYSESFTFANPAGDLYLTKAEKKRLGIIGARYFSVRPKIGDV